MASSTDSSCPLPDIESRDVYKFFMDTFELTEEDEKIKFTEEQLKELCLRRKCHVVGSRWNLVHEYGIWLRKEGRFDGRSARYARGMVAKGVNRHRHLMYDEAEIQRTREEEWRHQKKDNILTLRMWERERQKQQRENTEQGKNNKENDRQDNSRDWLDICDDFLEDISLSDSGPQDNDDGTRHETEKLASPNSEGQAATPEIILPDCSNEEDPLETENANPKIMAIFDVNTESLSLSQTASFCPTQSQEVFSDDFYSDIPCTSTQKESEEIQAV